MLGGDPWRDAATLHRRLAYVPGDVSLWPNLSGGEVIDVLARMRGGLDEARRTEMLERFDLDPTKKARTYSKGNRQKVALVAALASRADLYLLDEPTSGLDPLMEAEFQKAVLELKQEGATVLLSSHILAEAEALADRISIIRAGRVVQSGTLAELRHLTRTTVIAETDRPADGIAEVPGVHDPEVARQPRHLRRRLRPPRRGSHRARRARRTLPRRAPAHAGGALPASVRRRGDDGMSADPSGTSVTGVGHLLRLVLRRDRVRLPLWVVGLGGTIVASALAVPPLYDTPEKIAGYARTVGASPVSYLMSGRQVGLDTLGGIVANEISQVAQLGICLMVVFLVVRHTRAEEESGRAELLRSTVLGRDAATLAGLVYGVAAAVLLGAITTISMLAAGLDAGGSLTYGTGLALLGVAYTAVTLVAVQLSTSARGALGLAGARGRRRLPRARARCDGGQRARVALALRLGAGHGRLRRRALVAGRAAARVHRCSCWRWPPG